MIPTQSVTTNPPRNQSLRKGFGRKYTPLPMFLAELFPILVKAHKLAPLLGSKYLGTNVLEL